MLIYCQQNILFKHINWIPYTSSREAFLLNLEYWFKFQAIVFSLSFFLSSSCCYFIFSHFHILSNWKETKSNLSSLIHRLTKSYWSDWCIMNSNFSSKAPIFLSKNEQSNSEIFIHNSKMSRIRRKSLHQNIWSAFFYLCNK